MVSQGFDLSSHEVDLLAQSEHNNKE